MSTDTGLQFDAKVSSALLSKHVRTLEILYNIQLENNILKAEYKKLEATKAGASEEAVAIAVQKAIEREIPNALIEPTRRIEALNSKCADLADSLKNAQLQLKSANNATEKLLTTVNDGDELRHRLSSEKESLEALLGTLKRELAVEKDTSTEASQKYAANLLLESSRTNALQTMLKAQEQTLFDVKTALQEKSNQLELKVTELSRLKIELEKASSHQWENRLKEMTALHAKDAQILYAVKNENAIMADRIKDQEVAYSMVCDELAKRGEQADRAIAKLAEEQKRRKKLEETSSAERESHLQQSETDRAHYLESNQAHAIERANMQAKIEELLDRIDSLQAELHSGTTKFGKYVDVKKENAQLRTALDSMKATQGGLAVPRIGRRGSGNAIMALRQPPMPESSSQQRGSPAYQDNNSISNNANGWNKARRHSTTGVFSARGDDGSVSIKTSTPF